MDSRRIGVPRQHYAVTVDTVQLTHHVLDGNTATTNYVHDRYPAGADTLSLYCDRGRLFITLGTSPVLLLIKERCFIVKRMIPISKVYS